MRRNEIVINESKPSKTFIIRKNENCQEVKEMSDHSDSHLAMFINGMYALTKLYDKVVNWWENLLVKLTLVKKLYTAKPLNPVHLKLFSAIQKQKCSSFCMSIDNRTYIYSI